MQEFLTNNTVNCNLMSLTGYRTLVILGLLMESPKSTEEINEYFYNHQYIKEKFSNDTLRIYINSLRTIGCDITKANKSNNKKYELLSHPFAYDIPKPQLKAIVKIYKNIHHNVEVEEIIDIENFFAKLIPHIKNDNTKAFLNSISLLRNIDRDILDNILIHCKKKNQIVFLYNSPKSGPKEIEIVADKLSLKSGKLYLWGNNLTHKEYSYFSVEKIIKICSIKIQKNKEDFPLTKVVYEIYNHNDNYVLDENEKLIKKTSDKLLIESNSKNEFSLMQKILYMANDCKVTYPEEFKSRLLNKLKTMEKCYE